MISRSTVNRNSSVCGAFKSGSIEVRQTCGSRRGNAAFLIRLKLEILSSSPATRRHRIRDCLDWPSWGSVVLI